jgi:hypothetical protein
VVAELEKQGEILYMRGEVITPDEGDVVITFPENMSPESFGDLKDHPDLFIKKMQRRAGKSEAAN